MSQTPEQQTADSVPRDRRRLLGQFFTPPHIAEAMVAWVCTHAPKNLLDPAVGPGIFLATLQSSASPECTGIDIDPKMLHIAQQRLSGRDCELVKGDFLDPNLSLPAFDAIVCNPPYIRHRDAKVPDGAFDAIGKALKVDLAKSTNIYALFLLKIASFLSLRGRAAIITPMEFLNANFGVEVKRALLGMPAFRGIIMFDYADEIFDGAMTTAAITVLDATGSFDELVVVEGKGSHFPIRAFEALESGRGVGNIRVVRAKKDKLDPVVKWAAGGLFRPPAKTNTTHQLGEFVHCRRGIATGANSFFTLTAQEAIRWEIPGALLRPCITRASYAPDPVFTKGDHAELLASGKKALLLDASEEDADNIKKYIEHGKSTDIHCRYLTQSRSPWFSMERKLPADIWVAVFGRGRARFIQNSAGVRNLTAFHGIYLKEPYVSFWPILMACFHSPLFHEAAVSERRIYGGGLLKYEPRDVEKLPSPDLNRCGEREITESIRLFKEVVAGNPDERALDSMFLELAL